MIVEKAGELFGSSPWQVMFGRATAILPSLVFICSALPQTQHQNQTPTIRVHVDLVSVTAGVTDKQGRDVSGLTADDFSLFEDGRKQKISHFDTEKEPISLTILVDSSSSMNAEDKLGTAQAILEELVNRSRPEDELSVLQFTDHVVGIKEITREQRGPALATQITSESGGTAIYDALASALCHLQTSKNLRQAIVVITDGADQHSRLKLEQLIRLVQSSRAPLFIIGFYHGPEYSIYQQSDKTVTLVTGREIDNPLIVFDRLAKESGAEAFFPTSKKSLEEAVNKILNALRAQYTLSYYPDPEGSANALRHVQVKVNRGGLRIRARQSVGSPAPAGEGVEVNRDSCDVSAKAHPYPYEARLTERDGILDYREDFSDPRTGWPNNPGSRYVAKGYELSSSRLGRTDRLESIDTRPIGVGALAAYGPWWGKFRASVYVDGLDNSAAGIVFRLRDAGYYAFLLAHDAGQLSFKLEKKTYSGKSEETIVPWTHFSRQQAQPENTAGTKLTVECQGDQITLLVDDQPVARVRDTTYASGYIGFVSIGRAHAIFRDLDVEGIR